MAEAGYGEKGAFPPLEFLTGESFGDFKRNEYLTAQWQKLLGIEIELESLPRPMFCERLLADPPAIYDGGWIVDFPDPDNILRSSSFRSNTGWRNETYERLIQQAREMLDQEGRMALYRHVEDILVEEAPIIPLSYGRPSVLIKPWVRHFPTSPVKLWHWKDVIIEPH